MVILKKILLCMISMCSLTMQADFISVRVWQRKTDSDATQLLITLGDRHDKKALSDKQGTDLERFIAKHKESAIIIEDALDYNKSIDYLASLQEKTEKHAYMMSEFRDYQDNVLDATRRENVLNNQISPIVLVPLIAREQGVACENVEFRQLITFQLTGLLELIDDCGYDHGLVAQELLDRVCTEIAAFDDMPALNAYYKRVLESFAPVKALLDTFIAETDQPMVEFPAYVCGVIRQDPAAFDMAALTYASPLSFIVSQKEKTLALQDALLKNKDAVNSTELHKQVESDLIRHAFASLVDAYMLHALYQKQLVQDAPNITLLCAGLAHSMAVEEQIQALGYTQVAALEDNDGVVIGDALTEIVQGAIKTESNEFFDVVNAMMDGVKSAINAVGSFLGLA